MRFLQEKTPEAEESKAPEVQAKQRRLLLHRAGDCHSWSNLRWKEERCDPSLGEGTQPGPRGWRQPGFSERGETPSQQGWRDYQNMNANGVFMAFRLASDEHLNVLPETMLLMLREKLQASKKNSGLSGINLKKYESRCIGKREITSSVVSGKRAIIWGLKVSRTVHLITEEAGD